MSEIAELAADLAQEEANSKRRSVSDSCTLIKCLIMQKGEISETCNPLWRFIQSDRAFRAFSTEIPS